MGIVRSGDLATTGKRLAGDVELVIRGLATQPVVQFTVRFYDLAVRATPVGSRGASRQGGTSTATTTYYITSEHPGYLRSTLWTSVGVAQFRRPPPTVFPPPPDVAQALAILRTHQPDQAVHYTYGAPYSAIIEKGRRQVGGRWVGSPQAKDGWVLISAKKAVRDKGIGVEVKRKIGQTLGG